MINKREKLTMEHSEFPSFDLRFPAGATHLIIGASGSGKTYRVRDILLTKDNLFRGGEDIQNVVVFYADWQPAYTFLRDRKLVNKWVNHLPTNEEFVELVAPFQHKGGSIVVIDDFMSDINKELMKIVLNSTRHYNASTFILFQSLFPADNKIARQISLNAKFFHIFKNPRDSIQISQFARQLSP
jgi:hypothetical protein